MEPDSWKKILFFRKWLKHTRNGQKKLKMTFFQAFWPNYSNNFSDFAHMCTCSLVTIRRMIWRSSLFEKKFLLDCKYQVMSIEIFVDTRDLTLLIIFAMQPITRFMTPIPPETNVTRFIFIWFSKYGVFCMQRNVWSAFDYALLD